MSIYNRAQNRQFRSDLGVPTTEERQEAIRSAHHVEEQVYAGLDAHPHLKPVKRVFFSPHPDDVAYSCYGLASMTAKQAAMTDNSDDTGSASSAATCNSGASASTSASTTTSTSAPLFSPTYLPTFASGSLGLSLTSDQTFDRSTRDERKAGATQKQLQQNEWQQSVIVTVFDKSRCANGAIGASLRHCVKETTAMRRREDEAFAKSVGAKLISLGLSDTSARDEGSRHPELLAAAASRNTASRLSVDHPMFDVVKERIKPIVQWAVKNHATIHIPLAVGCHIDHWMVRVAVLSSLVDIEHEVQWAQLKNAQRQTRLSGVDPIHILALAEQAPAMQGSHLIFYEDLPYGFIGTDDMVQQTVAQFLPRDVRVQLVPMTDTEWDRKMKAVKSYASQMKTTLLDMLHDHARMLAKRGSTIDDQWHDAPASWTMAERSWVLDEVCGPTANLLASLNAISDRPVFRRESRAAASAAISPVERRASIRNSPALALRALPITFSSPFDIDRTADSLAYLTVKQRVDEDAISPLMRPNGRLRKMSSCPRVSSNLIALREEALASKQAA